jgi:VanZ family protein
VNAGSAPPLSRGRIALAALLYALFVVYGSLIPFDLRPRPTGEALAAFQAIPYLELGVGSRADWVANILLYMPLSFLGTAAVAVGRRPWAAALGAAAVAAACVALAFGTEFAQLFFPPRTVSQNDLIAETIGTALGIALWFGAGPRLLGLWRGVLGRQAWLSARFVLFVLGYLALSFFPYDLLVSAAELHDKLANPAVVTWGIAGSCGGALSCSVKLFTEVLVAMPIGALLAWAVPAMRVPGALFVGLAIGLVIEGGQLLLASGVSQGVSLSTRALGVAWGLALQHTLRLELIERHARGLRAAVLAATPLYLAALMGLNGFAGRFEAPWMAAEKLRAAHFTPFYYHYFTSETAAMWSLLANAAAYAPVGIALWLLRPRAKRAGFAAAIAAAIALAVEAMKLFVAAAKPDPTNVLIAAASAALVHAALARLVAQAAPHRAAPHAAASAAASAASPAQSPPGPHRRKRSGRRLAWAGLASTAAVIASARCSPRRTSKRPPTNRPCRSWRRAKCCRRPCCRTSATSTRACLTPAPPTSSSCGAKAAPTSASCGGWPRQPRPTATACRRAWCWSSSSPAARIWPSCTRSCCRPGSNGAATTRCARWSWPTTGCTSAGTRRSASCCAASSPTAATTWCRSSAASGSRPTTCTCTTRRSRRWSPARSRCGATTPAASR